MLETFGTISDQALVHRSEGNTMDAATVLDREREGGGAPSERPPAGTVSRWASLKSALGWMVR